MSDNNKKVYVVWIDNKPEWFLNYWVESINRGIICLTDGNDRIFIALRNIKYIKDYNKITKEATNNEFCEQQF